MTIIIILITIFCIALMSIVLHFLLKIFGLKEIKLKQSLVIILLYILFSIVIKTLLSILIKIQLDKITLLLIQYLLSFIIIGFILYKKHKINFRKGIFIGFLQELISLIIIITIVFFVRVFIISPYTVVGSAMSPSLIEGDFLIINKNIHNLKRGDVIVFVPPGKDIPYIKRIIGLPGETVKIKENKILICTDINSKESCSELNEPYLDKNTQTDTKCDIDEFKISGSGLFVMGDNRGFSTDSRCCFGLGCDFSGVNYEVDKNNVIGKVSTRIFPNFTNF